MYDFDAQLSRFLFGDGMQNSPNQVALSTSPLLPKQKPSQFVHRNKSKKTCFSSMFLHRRPHNSNC